MVTNDEWKKIVKLAPEFVILPHNAGMGFNFGLTFFEAPQYPCLPLEALLSIEGGHFDLRFSDAYTKMMPLANNKVNRERMKLYGLGEIKEKSYYDY